MSSTKSNALEKSSSYDFMEQKDESCSEIPMFSSEDEVSTVESIVFEGASILPENDLIDHVERIVECVPLPNEEKMRNMDSISVMMVNLSSNLGTFSMT